MNRAKRHAVGCVRFDKRRGTWNYLFYESGKRRSRLIGTKQQYPTKAAAWKAVSLVEPVVEAPSALNVLAVIDNYRKEKMPTRIKTRKGYETWFKNYIVPRWGNSDLHELQSRPVELWLASLELAPKSKVHIRGLISALWDYAMWSSAIPVQRNPMELCTVKGGSQRMTKPRSLTVEEFQKFAAHLEEPYRLLAQLSVCLGLRISEALALKWADVDWLNGTLRVARRICSQIVDSPKSRESQKDMALDSALLERLKFWKQTAQFSTNEDWIFASSVRLGRLPFCYAQIWNTYEQAGVDAEIGHVSTHVLRHTYRAWLNTVGTSLAVQQKMMRHTDIRTTMNYGDVFSEEIQKAGTKITQLALNGAQAERKAS